MPIDLDALVDTEALGRVTVFQAVEDLVAKPNHAPKAWQSVAPDMAHENSKVPVMDSEDLQRIKALPRRQLITEDSPDAPMVIKAVTQRYARKRSTPCNCARIYWRFNPNKPPRNPSCITELNLTQAIALFEMGAYGGLFGPIGVGHGKTILDILAPLAFKECKRATLLVPPGLVLQLICEYEMLREHFRVPNLITISDVRVPNDEGEAPKDGRPYMATGEDGEPITYVLPYSLLQRARCTTKLYEIEPDLIISDEAHKLRNIDTAGASRVFGYVEAQQNETPPIYVRGAAWSGSFTEAAITDYGPTAALCLRERSPVPHDRDALEDWGRCINPKFAKTDKDRDPNNPWSKAAPAGALLQLDDGRGGHVTEVFYRRLTETPGVVATTSPAVKSELVIVENTPRYPTPDVILNHLDVLREQWIRPDGEQLVDALTVARVARELAAGFHYYWYFPNGEPMPLILEWLDVRKRYRQELRWFLSNRKPYLDSPMLAELAAKRFYGDINTPELPEGESHEAWEMKHPLWESMMWPEWRDIKGLVKPETRAQRIDDYLARDASEWGQENRGIIWYDSSEFGKWVAELSGLTRHGGGPDAGAEIGKEDGKRSIIASIKSHGTGRDGLQRIFCDQLFAQPPASATTWEQALGRLHRVGQAAPQVFARFNRHTEELAAHVDQALARATYVERTMGAKQKLRLGFKLADAKPVIANVTYDPFDDDESDDDIMCCGHTRGAGECHDCG